MLKKLLALLGKTPTTAGDTYAPSAPYRQDELNLIYNLLFCDNAALFKRQQESASLFGELAEPDVVRTIADDSDEESRVRILACNWLRDNGHPVPARELMGVIVEVPLDDGLDVLAAYADGTVRYINQTGKFAVFESSPPDIVMRAQALVEISRPALRHSAAAQERRPPPPAIGNIRLTYLASDGLHVSQGTFEAMAKNARASAVIQSAQDLLDLVVKQASE
ncbi:MAG: hypothetical protein V4724_25550 [Pseudomonadota bacterium]